MRTFDRVHEQRTKAAPERKVEERLSFGQSAAVISGLSVLSWGVVALFVVTVRAIF
jgi:hypothetical protein